MVETAEDGTRLRGRVKEWRKIQRGGVGRLHAFERFYDHYGFDPTLDEWKSASQSIKDRTALLIAIQSDGSEMWSVTIRGMSVRLVYNPKTQQVITTNSPERRALRRS